MEWLWINASIHAIVAAVFVAVGTIMWRRPALGDAKLALLAFASWWLLYALQSAITSLRVVIVALGSRDPALYQGLFVAENSLSVWALWGLGAYIGYLRAGDRRGWLPWGIVVVALSMFYFVVVATARIVSVGVGTWGTRFEFANPLGAAEQFALVLGYYGVLVGLTVMLAILARRAGNREAKFRSYSLVAGIGILSVAGVISLGVQAEVGIRPVLSVSRLLAAGIVWVAYRPPAALRPWLAA